MGRVFYFGDLTTHCNLSKWVFMKFWISRVMLPQWQICRVFVLAHWGWVINMYVSKLNTIGWDNGLSPDRRQAIIWSNAGILLAGPLGTNLSEISIETFSFKKRHLKVSSAKWRPLCLRLNVLKIPTFGNRCLSAIGGGKQRSRLAGWVQLSAETAPGHHGVPPSPAGRWEYRWCGKFTWIAAL